MTETLAQRAERTTIAMEKAGYPAVAACLRALVAANAQLERERDEAERDAERWIDVATYEVGGSPHYWKNRAQAAERKLHDRGHDDWYCGGTVPGSFAPVPSYAGLRAERDAANAARVAAEGTLRAAKALMDDINEFGGCSDGRIFDAAWTQVTAALTPAPEAPTDGE